MRSILRHAGLFFRTLGWSAVLVLVTRGAEESRRKYDVPAGAATATLQRFSDVSGREVLFASEVVRRVKTKAVHGEFTPLEALQRMMEGTQLRVLQDEQTGALAVLREDARPRSLAAAGYLASTVILSPFEVQMTQDKGYNVFNSSNALKTEERILDIPQSLVVITRDMIDDIGSSNLSDILNYVGVSNFYQGDSAIVRGRPVSLMCRWCG